MHSYTYMWDVFFNFQRKHVRTCRVILFSITSRSICCLELWFIDFIMYIQCVGSIEVGSQLKPKRMEKESFEQVLGICSPIENTRRCNFNCL